MYKTKDMSVLQGGAGDEDFVFTKELRAVRVLVWRAGREDLDI